VQEEHSPPGRTTVHADAPVGVGPSDIPLGARERQLATTEVSSPTTEAWRRFYHNWAALISLSVIVIAVVMAAFAPFMHTSSPLSLDFNSLDQGPSPMHWFGTDGTGHDQYSRLLYGLRVPLIVGIVGTFVTVVLGTLLGIVSGYFGGVVDGLLSRFTDVIFAFPGFTLALIVVSLFGPALDPYFGGGGRVIILTLVFAIVSWPPLMRFVRSLALTMKEQQFVEAARTVGTSHWGIMFRHLLPNMWGLILVQASFIVVSVVSTETVLSIFGLGVEPPNPDLGAMLYEGVQRIGFNYWEVIVPSIALTIIILAFTFLADGVRDAVDPRSRS
jgi:oligopeptide transport system permease protein